MTVRDRFGAGVLLCSICLVLGACSSESRKDADPAPQPHAAARVSEDHAAPQNALPTAEELPVAEDFVEEMETAVTEENYRTELDRLAKVLEEAKRL